MTRHQAPLGFRTRAQSVVRETTSKLVKIEFVQSYLPENLSELRRGDFMVVKNIINIESGEKIFISNDTYYLFAAAHGVSKA